MRAPTSATATRDTDTIVTVSELIALSSGLSSRSSETDNSRHIFYVKVNEVNPGPILLCGAQPILLCCVVMEISTGWGGCSMSFKARSVQGPRPPTGPSNAFAPMKSIMHGAVRIIGQ
jgi:hypothetical protein